MGAVKEAHNRVNMPELDRVVITLITDNYYDALRPDAAITKRFRAKWGKSMHAEHGLSCFIETVSKGVTGRFMFDYGLDAGGVMGNMEVLGIDLGKADALGLSHGHFDHWGGLTGIITGSRARIGKGIPLYLGEEAFEERYLLAPGSDMRAEIGQLNRPELEALGLRIVEVKSPVEVIPGAYFTGRIERVTEYEKESPVLLVKREGAVVADTFPGEQAMAFNVKGKGLVVLSGCAHAGIVNTVKHVQKMTGITKVHAVVGGFHLVNAQPEIIARTVADLKAINPDYIVPAHCTGFEATVLLAEEMPGRFILNTAGTQYTFSA